MTNEAEQSASEEQENPEEVERQKRFNLGKTVAETWADQVKNRLETQRGEWVHHMALEDAARSMYAASGWRHPGFSEGIEQGLKNKGIEKRQGTKEEESRGMGGDWYRVV